MATGTQDLEERYTVDGAPCVREQLRVRTMNFGQHWRTPNIPEVRYEAVVPDACVVAKLEEELAGYIADSIEYPDEGSALENLLRAHRWPSAREVLASEVLAPPVLDYFAHELLCGWFGFTEPMEPRFVMNTLELRRAPGCLVFSGVARRTGMPVRFQDD